MPIPEVSAYFEPQNSAHFYAAQGALFLIDPARVQSLLGEQAYGSDLLKTLTRKDHPHEAYRNGGIVPALGVDQIHFTVTIRSSETTDAPLPLSHMLFSTGFVLGTETGDLLLCNSDRLADWSPGQTPRGHEEHPLANFERMVHISPGWYAVTVVTGLCEPYFKQSADRHPNVYREDEWVCAFLLDPKPVQPDFVADLTLPLAV